MGLFSIDKRGMADDLWLKVYGGGPTCFLGPAIGSNES